MEEQDASDYNEPCVQCSDVNWSLTEEGKFYCRSCHNVTERIKEVVTSEATTNARAKSLSRGLKKKSKFDKGWKWYICEGFQFILCKQADALQSLGVSSRMKDEVLCNFWRRYLQKSKDAYCTEKPIDDVPHESMPTCDSSTEADSELDITKLVDLACSASDTEVVPESSIGDVSSSKTSGRTLWSGSVDAQLYLRRLKKGEIRMSMPMTLAFCCLALLWLREPITLSDLLRLVTDGHIPYVNIYKDFPEEMKMYGADFKIFHVQSWPEYEDVHKKMHDLAAYLDLPCFPEITERSFLHPNILCMKYLMEVNLPDDMHIWTCRVVKKTGIGEKDFLTLHPENKSSKVIKYDILAVAVIVTVLKILFLLDDQYEWLRADYAKEKNEKNQTGSPVFDIKNWYLVVKKVLDVEQKQFNEQRIRHLWRCDKPPVYSTQRKWVAVKRRQMVVDLQKQFRALAGCQESSEKQKPSSFKFNWTQESTEINCFHGHSLDAVLQQKGKVLTTRNRVYWLCTIKLCKSEKCRHQLHYKESAFPDTYQFVLSLFSFLLRVPPSLIHEEVCALEHKLFRSEIDKKFRQ